MHKALVFEFVRNGSLDNHISGHGCSGLNWHIHYKIIKGICLGLQYLQHGFELSIWHLDLKPENILLDDNMTPKIADFGLSRLLGDENTRKTINAVGTRGYLPPEYIDQGLLSKKFDIFSLGVIIAKLMAGTDLYFKIDEMGEQGFVNHVNDKWRKRLRATLGDRPLEVYCEQVRMCIQIAVKCMNHEREERPTIQSIVSDLEETEKMIGRLGLETEQFCDEEPVLLEGGIQARTPVQTKGRKIPMLLRRASASDTMVSRYRPSEAVGISTETLGSESGFVSEEYGAKMEQLSDLVAAGADEVGYGGGMMELQNSAGARQRGERCLPPAMSRPAGAFMRAERRGGRLILTREVRPVERPREVLHASRSGGRRLLEVRRNCTP